MIIISDKEADSNMMTETFKLNYMDFDEIKADLKTFMDESKISTSSVDNSITITGNAIQIAKAKDVIAQKDISEVYNFDLEDNIFGWILEDTAGNENADENKFFRNNFYPNTGICLINVKLWRENNLYKKSILVSRAYHILPCPYQDIIFVVSDFKFKFMPLKYNCKLFFENDEQMKNKDVNSKYIKKWIENQKYSPYRYSVEEILEAAIDPVINHIYQEKIYKGIGCNKLTMQWIKYAMTSGFYEEIKKKYPIPFDSCGHLL
jgi:lipopolysaccharide biosynthesis glycosyltransferase